MLYKNKKAQSVLEYALLFTVFVTALLAMQMFLKRSMQGKFREIANELSPQHYAAGHTTTGPEGIITKSQSETISKTETEVAKGNNPDGSEDRIKTTSTTEIINDLQTRSGSETFSN